MTDTNSEQRDFDAEARQELDRLKDLRAQFRRQLDEIDHKINGLRIYLGEVQPNQKSAQPRRATGPRGRKMTTIIDVLREAVPSGLSIDEIIAAGEGKGVSLLRPSLRSQLSKANTNGYVVNRKGRYYHPSAINRPHPNQGEDLFKSKDAPPEQPGEASNSEGAA